MKIFGIGMQRTGTTSLAGALNQLGIKTLQFPEQLFRRIDHPVLQKYDGFTDNPLPLLYRELDARCPGSKFILTVREEESWLTSVEWLFSTGAEKFSWNRKPIVHEMHRALYGTTHFERTRFLEVYRAHNAAVRAHFAARPQDLLVLDVEAGEGYDKLCPFLARPVPADTAFPHRNRQENVWQMRYRRFVRAMRTRLAR